MSIGDILTKIIGPILFCAAFLTLISLRNGINDYSREARKQYLEGRVYAQHDVRQDNDDSVERDELVGILQAHPSVSMRIEIPAQFIQILVKTQKYSLMELNVRRTDLNKVIFHNISNSLEGFPLDTIAHGKYNVDYEYDDGGKLCCVVYTWGGE